MARKTQFEGEVQAKSRAGTGLAFNIDGEDVWFNAREPEQIPDDVAKGDIVAFEYDTSSKGGKTFRNIQGDVELVEKGEGASRPPARSSGGRGAPQRSGGSSRGAPARSAPAGGPDRRDIQIVRQNAMTQANALLSTYPDLIDVEGLSGADVAAEVVDIAKVFADFALASA